MQQARGQEDKWGSGGEREWGRHACRGVWLISPSPFLPFSPSLFPLPLTPGPGGVLEWPAIEIVAGQTRHYPNWHREEQQWSTSHYRSVFVFRWSWARS